LGWPWACRTLKPAPSPASLPPCSPRAAAAAAAAAAVVELDHRWHGFDQWVDFVAGGGGGEGGGEGRKGSVRGERGGG